MSGAGVSKLVESTGNDDLRKSEIELDRAIDNLKGIAEVGRASGSSGSTATMEPGGSAIMNIPVDVQAVFGAVKMSLAELSALGPGSTILLDRNAGDPIDIFANGIRIATGEMVLQEDDGGRFGFRLVDVLT
jgi:flagellar motor switch protein FliN